ncbi:MAG TPA: response regulator transcription factor, partial [Spirochaetia bacterium]|nr:response regulator transcription factor [Spirochaetia bacterium]
EAQTGREAVEKASQVSLDVVVMDMRMPDLGGIEATRAIHDRFPAVRVIGFSALEDPAQVAAMREAGAVGYVVKSDPPGRLLATIRACFEPAGA